MDITKRILELLEKARQKAKEMDLPEDVSDDENAENDIENSETAQENVKNEEPKMENGESNKEQEVKQKNDYAEVVPSSIEDAKKVLEKIDEEYVVDEKIDDGELPKELILERREMPSQSREDVKSAQKAILDEKYDNLREEQNKKSDQKIESADLQKKNGKREYQRPSPTNKYCLRRGS